MQCFIASKQLQLYRPANPIFNLPLLIENVPESAITEERISPETTEAYSEFFKKITDGEQNGETVFQLKSSNGWRWVEARFSAIFQSSGEPASSVISFADVTDNFEKDIAYKKWRQSLQVKDVDTYSLYRCNITKNRLIDAEGGTLLKVQFTKSFVFNKQTAEYVAEFVANDDASEFMSFLNSEKLLSSYYCGKRTLTLEYREKLTGDAVRWLRLTVDLVEAPHSNDIEAYLLFENIDSEKREELATLALAQTDPLTGVLNRLAFSEQVDALIANANPSTCFALMMLDIDVFKMVNDVFGHSVGDEVLMNVAELLHSVLRKGDLLGRLGGDEFLIFLNNIPGDGVAENKAKQICKLAKKSLSHEVRISVSVGIVSVPKEGSDFETLYKKVDAALYCVKGSGKDNYTFYNNAMPNEYLHCETNSVLSHDIKRSEE